MNNLKPYIPPIWQLEAFIRGDVTAIRLPIKNISPRYTFAKAVCLFKPRYRKGDILYIKEPYKSFYRGDEKIFLYKDDDTENKLKHWKSPATMPREAARFYIEVMSEAQVERVQDITELQLIKEGVRDDHNLQTDIFTPAGYTYIQYWNEKHRKTPYAYDNNPYTQYYEVRRVER